MPFSVRMAFPFLGTGGLGHVSDSKYISEIGRGLKEDNRVTLRCTCDVTVIDLI